MAGADGSTSRTHERLVLETRGRRRGSWAAPSARARAALIAGCALACSAPTPAWPIELRAAVGAGYAKVVEGHGSVSAQLRLQLTRFLFVQPEYLALRAGDHTDQGPVLVVGLSGTSRKSLRPYLGLGGGPVRGYQGDDGLVFAAAGVSYPVSRTGLFVQAEARFGLLGESGYSQYGVALGISR